MTPPSSPTPLSELMEIYLSGEISKDDLARLEAELKTSEDLRREFIHKLTIGDAIYSAAKGQNGALNQQSDASPSFTKQDENPSSLVGSRNWLLVLSVLFLLSVPMMATASYLAKPWFEPADNEHAFRLVRNGFRVRTSLGDELTGKDFPDEDFFIRSIEFTDRRGTPIPVYTEDLRGWLPVLTRLDEISLADTNLQNDALPLLAMQPRLRTIKLGGNPDLTPEGLQVLKKLKRLEGLSISDLGPDMWKLIGELPTLRSVDISRRTTTDAADVLASVKKLPRLSLLSLGIAPTWKDSDLAALGQLKQLRFLAIDGAQFTDEGVADFVEAVIENQVPLETVILNNSPGITAKSHKAFGELRTLKHLEVN